MSDISSNDRCDVRRDIRGSERAHGYFHCRSASHAKGSPRTTAWRIAARDAADRHDSRGAATWCGTAFRLLHILEFGCAWATRHGPSSYAL